MHDTRLWHTACPCNTRARGTVTAGPAQVSQGRSRGSADLRVSRRGYVHKHAARTVTMRGAPACTLSSSFFSASAADVPIFLRAPVHAPRPPPTRRVENVDSWPCCTTVINHVAASPLNKRVLTAGRWESSREWGGGGDRAQVTALGLLACAERVQLGRHCFAAGAASSSCSACASACFRLRCCRRHTAC